VIFPTRDAWYDAVWPKIGLFRTLVLQCEGPKFTAAAKIALKLPEQIFLFVVQDFNAFSMEIPESWRRMPPQGGMPGNVWVGAAFRTNDELHERATRLLKIRARRLFLLAEKDHETPELFDYLEPWRCMHCGRRGFTEVPEYCPTGSICAGYEDQIMPQITWVVDSDRDKNSELAPLCERMRVALWDGVKKEVPA
jgi:hypothetical protein